MEQNLNNKIEVKDRLLNFYENNKKKIIISIAIVILATISIIIKQNYNTKQNIVAADKYIKAEIQLKSNKDEAKELFKDIILSKNKFYSILALNTIIEKNLISNEEEILKYFEILENLNYTDEKKDLIIFKKALYLIKITKKQEGNNLLKKLIKKDSRIKNLAKELVEN